MRHYLLACLSTSLVFLSTIFVAPIRAFAETPPQIELSVSQASPGATIEVMGGRFPEDVLVKFVLQNTVSQISLGTALADDHGEFSVTVLLPLDMQLGKYEFQAIDEKDQMAKAPITIIADTSGQEMDGQREDSDGLLAPMPSFAPGVSSTPLPQATALEPSLSKRFPPILIYSILAGVGILAFLSIRILKKR
jgi:hypothetical protein